MYIGSKIVKTILVQMLYDTFDDDGDEREDDHDDTAAPL